MKKILILAGALLLSSGLSAMSACSIDKIQSGKTCSVINNNNLNINPIKPSNTNQSLPNPNKDSFAPQMEAPDQVRDLGTTPAQPNNSPAGPYNSNCQFGVCPPGINNREFIK